MSGQQAVRRNRLVLVGAVLYFLEWVAIPFVADLPTNKFGSGAHRIAEAYADHPASVAFAAGWFSLVLLGRLAFIAGIKAAMGRDRHGLLDWALGAMGVSIAIEIASYAAVGAAAWLAHAHASASGIVALDALGSILFILVATPFAVSVVSASMAMHAAGFPKWIAWLGMVSGTLAVGGGTISAMALGSTGTIHTVGEQLLGAPAGLIWIWMVATSVYLFRRPALAE